MIIQLFIFALFFMGFGIYSLIKRKTVIGLLFLILGVLLFIIASFVVSYYPDKMPF
jgi:hypothetical protein